MSRDGVHTDEMPEPSDDLWPAGDPVLAALAEDLRIVASGPAPEPRPGLVAVMAQGRVRPSEPDAGRRKMLVKTFLGSLAAKVAVGVGLATASVAAAGATGVLPAAAQHAVASVVSATTPFSIPDPSSFTGTGVTGSEEPAGSTTTTSSTSPTSTTVAGGTGSGPTTTVAETDDKDGTGTTGTTGHPDNHGACVSAIAQDKSATSDTDNHGKIVSTVAKSDCGKTSPSTTVPGSSTTSSSTSTTVAGGSSVKGTNGKGNGNSGNSDDGKGGSGKGGKG